MSVTIECAGNTAEISAGQRAVINATRQKMTSDITILPATGSETVKVMYNGNNIALLDGTKTATLKCNGKVMKGSVVVSIVSNDTDDTIIASQVMADLIAEFGWDNKTTKQEFKLDNNVTVKVDGGANSGKAYNGDHIRLFATDVPITGRLIISVPEGYELVSVKVSAQTGTYAFLYVDGTTTDIKNIKTAVSGSSVVLVTTKNSFDGKQVRVTAIEVEYKKNIKE